MIDVYPKICNICGERVEYISNTKIYGRQYGSGYCYRCTVCGAYVGTHKPWPRKAMGILANAEMREWKMKCHGLFDSFWNGTGRRRRNQLYIRLAGEMGIPAKDCHFGYFDLRQLRLAYRILEEWKDNPPEKFDYEEAAEPCLSCHLADWADMYGTMVYACDMSSCYRAEVEGIDD